MTAARLAGELICGCRPWSRRPVRLGVFDAIECGLCGKLIIHGGDELLDRALRLIDPL